MHRHSLAVVLFASATLLTRGALGQDANIILPVARVDSLLRHGTIRPVAAQGSRFEGDRTEHALLVFDDSTAFEVKWATSARGGEAFNNQPRYEAAAYALQRLYLDDRDLVVPPTVLRMVPAAVFATAKLRGEPTFDDTPSILVALQYWTMDVTADDVFDTKRAERDSVYARHLGDLNILTYLIRQRDANKGNILVSIDSTNPRLFAVDNGVAFESAPSNRGTEWQHMRVKRVSAATAARLRAISDTTLTRALGVIAQFERRGDEYVAAEPGANLDPQRGVRRNATILQFGLTRSEIDGVRDRLRDLIERIDRGKIRTF
jgi:hypothetical protein